LLCLIALASAVYIHLNIPRLDLRFEVSGNGKDVLALPSESSGSEAPAGIVRSISAAGMPPVSISSFVLLEEPDILSASEFNRFMSMQSSIRSMLDAPAVQIHLQDGRILNTQPGKAGISDLPLLFWLQCYYGLSAFMIGLGIWAFRRNKLEARLLNLVGVGFAVGGVSAAVYSTRQLAMNGELFAALSSISHLGVFIFIGFLMALLWCYPRRLAHSRNATRIATGSILLFWMLEQMQIIDFYLLFILLFTAACALAFRQWRASRDMPLNRAALQWFLLSISVSIATFFTTVMFPGSLGHPPLIGSQGSMLIMIWLMFIGIALGVVRYKLFNLGAWWLYVWLWFIGGVVVIASDLALFAVWSLPQSMALPLALALAGWLYFPLRQWIWIRLVPQRKKVEDFIPHVLENFLRCRTEADILKAWSTLVETAFSPLRIKTLPDSNGRTEILDNGLTLLLPGLREDQALRLEYANHGRRLFTEDDRKLAEALFKMVQQSSSVTRAEQKGAAVERERIKRELHDGLGSKIMAIMHSTPGQQDVLPLAKDAWRELRAIVSTIQGEHRPASEVFADWRSETRHITDAVHIQLDWQVELGQNDIVLSPLQMLNLGRSLAEGVQNAMRHGSPEKISVRFAVHGDKLHLHIHDDGSGAPPETWLQGRGTHHIINRIEELGGEAIWHAAELQGTDLLIQIPIEEPK